MTTTRYFVILLVISICGCRDYQPKPYAYSRIMFPEHTYEKIESDCPFTFEKPEYARLERYKGGENPCWYNLNYTPFNATLHLSYIPIRSTHDLDSLTEDAYKMVFKPHLQRAEEIIEREISDSSKGLFGMIYDLEGKTATPFNFYITDGNQHFFRGSFYFNARTKQDSVMPIYQFINKDILQSIKTFEFR